MPIVVNLDVMMARRHKGAGELAEEIGITPANLSILKNNKAKAVRFSTLEALCKALDCQPGDILKIVTDEEFDRLVEERRKTGEARVKAGLRRTAPERVYEIDLDLGGE